VAAKIIPADRLLWQDLKSEYQLQQLT
jgi:hypothetical protein